MAFSGLISGPGWVRLTVVNAVPGRMNLMCSGLERKVRMVRRNQNSECRDQDAELQEQRDGGIERPRDRVANSESGRKSIVHSPVSMQRGIAAAIARVLSGDVDAYAVIYELCDRPLRSYVGARYGHLGDDFVDEVATCTHEYVFQNLDKYNPGDSSLQTWINWASRNVALSVLTERFNLRKVKTADGKWERVAVSIAMDEEALALVARTVPGPEEIRDAEWQQHLLWQEYDALANDGRLSVTRYDLGDRSLADVARELGMPVIRLRRLLEKNHRRLRGRLKRAGVSQVEREPHYGRVWQDPDVTWYDDDWTATQTADPPDEPDTLVGAVAREKDEG